MTDWHIRKSDPWSTSDTDEVVHRRESIIAADEAFCAAMRAAIAAGRERAMVGTDTRRAS